MDLIKFWISSSTNAIKRKDKVKVNKISVIGILKRRKGENNSSKPAVISSGAVVNKYKLML